MFILLSCVRHSSKTSVRLIVLHKLGTPGRIVSLCKVDGIDRSGGVDLCTYFGAVSLVHCVDSFDSVREVDKIDVVGGVCVKVRDGRFDVVSIGRFDDVIAVKRADACS